MLDVIASEFQEIHVARTYSHVNGYKRVAIPVMLTIGCILLGMCEKKAEVRSSLGNLKVILYKDAIFQAI